MTYHDEKTHPAVKLGAFRIYVCKVLCMCFVKITNPL